MRWLGLALGLALALGLMAACQRGPSKVDRGKYLVTAGPCAECHTQRVAGNPNALDTTKWLAGGEKFEIPGLGVIYSTNITPDKETGIGNWTDAELRSAMTEGLGKGGRKLVLMPWPVFKGLASSDVEAVIVYLRSVKAIRNPVPPSQLQPPREAVYGQAAQAAAAIPKGQANPPTETLAKGRYLATALLGCTECHGPNLSGGTPLMPIAANITPDKETGIGNWTDDQIIKAFTQNQRPDRPLAPIMPALTAYTNLTADDVKAVLAFLKSVSPVKKKIGPPGPPPGR